MKKLLFALCLFPGLLKAQNKQPKAFNLLIGSYTSNSPDGIYVYRFYEESGRLAYLNRISGVVNPSYLCVSNNHKFIYAVNESGSPSKGGVSALSFEPKTGRMALLNQQTSGAGPCYISVDKAQKFVFTANYMGGSLSVFPVNADGTLAPAVQTIQDEGHGYNKERQDKPHVHTGVLSPDEKHFLYSDLGTDKLNIYRYKPSQSQPLTPSEPSALNVMAGDGPRHVDFSPNRKYLYLITEMGGNIYVYNYNNGKPKQLQTISLVPDGYTGNIGAADIHVSPDGRFLYASNRGDANEIIVYAINRENGTLSLVEHQSGGGISPRNFVIDPTGSYLLVANQKSNNVVVFKINKNTGKLLATNIKIEVSEPSCLKFTPAE